jgi:hypothetical protein
MDSNQKRIMDVADAHFENEFARWLVENPSFNRDTLRDVMKTNFYKFYILGLMGRAASLMVEHIEAHGTKPS